MKDYTDRGTKALICGSLWRLLTRNWKLENGKPNVRDGLVRSSHPLIYRATTQTITWDPSIRRPQALHNFALPRCKIRDDFEAPNPKTIHRWVLGSNHQTKLERVYPLCSSMILTGVTIILDRPITKFSYTSDWLVNHHLDLAITVHSSSCALACCALVCQPSTVSLLAMLVL
jgi:hypothetical protein